MTLYNAFMSCPHRKQTNLHNVIHRDIIATLIHHKNLRQMYACFYLSLQLLFIQLIQTQLVLLHVHTLWNGTNHFGHISSGFGYYAFCCLAYKMYVDKKDG